MTNQQHHEFKDSVEATDHIDQMVALLNDPRVANWMAATDELFGTQIAHPWSDAVQAINSLVDKLHNCEEPQPEINTSICCVSRFNKHLSVPASSLPWFHVNTHSITVVASDRARFNFTQKAVLRKDGKPVMCVYSCGNIAIRVDYHRYLYLTGQVELRILMD